jgi:3D (Asp-Asp-Asp) domain-containing protein
MSYYAVGFLVCCMGLPLQATSILPPPATQVKDQGKVPVSSDRRLCRVTAYWASEGDYYTSRLISATGVHLHDGQCAVDPSIIPYGSVVDVAGVGKFLAVDTGSAVVTRKATREDAHTTEERNALVIDLFFKSRKAGEAFAANTPKYTFINWRTPSLSSTFLPTPAITPISMLLRMDIPIHPLRSPDETAPISMLLRPGIPRVAVLRSSDQIAIPAYAVK